jgi:MFS family permease
MALVCYARIAEPIAFFSIFPFIAQMVQRNGHLPSSDVGFYSGLIESLFSATQMLVLVAWGRLADRVGRKPILMTSLVGMTISPVLFGLSRSLWQMILFRCLAGIFSGSSLIIRTMIAEISTKDTQATAYGWFAFAGNIGIFIGPLIGGVLADPAEQYPKVFGGIYFFETYPYALAGAVPGVIAASAAILCAFFLTETLGQNDKKPSSNGNASGASDEEAAKMSMWQLLHSPNVGTVLLAYGYVMFLAFAFTALVPIVLYTPVDLGGMGFSSTYISLFMAVNGASQALWLILVFPRLHKRFGTKGVMWGCAVAYPWFFASYIGLSALLRNGSEPALIWFWSLASLVAVIGPGVSMAFTATQLALNDASPSTHILGTLNAVALTMSSGIRSIVPGVITVIYAVGVRNQILGGHLAWVILTPLAAALVFVVKALPRDTPPSQRHNGTA